MEFDINKIYTVVNADEVKLGSKVIVADTLGSLKMRVEENTGQYLDTLKGINSDNNVYCFDIGDCNYYMFCYLVSEPKVDTRIAETINRHEAVVRINREFKESLERRFPDMDSHTFALMVDSFQKGFEKGTALTFNAFSSDIKLCVFNDDLLSS